MTPPPRRPAAQDPPWESVLADVVFLNGSIYAPWDYGRGPMDPRQLVIPDRDHRTLPGICGRAS